MNLDENYSAATKLSAWWKQVKNNFSAIKTEFSSVTAKLDQKVNKTDYASTTKAGVIKLAASGGGTNNSGLVVFEDGSAAVNVRPDRGIKRDGAGQIGTNPATQAEVNDGTDEYKPITPKTLKAVMDTLPEFEATEFEEFGKEYKGGSMRYLYNTSSYEPEADHLYIYNDKLADSSLQPDGTVGTEVGWVELAFKHDVTAVAEDTAQLKKMSSYSATPVQIGTWADGMPIIRLYVNVTDVKNSEYVYISSTNSEMTFSIDDYLVDFNMGDGDYKVLSVSLVCSDDIDNWCFMPIYMKNKYAYFSDSSRPECHGQVEDFGGRIIGYIDVVKIS